MSHQNLTDGSTREIRWHNALSPHSRMKNKNRKTRKKKKKNFLFSFDVVVWYKLQFPSRFSGKGSRRVRTQATTVAPRSYIIFISCNFIIIFFLRSSLCRDFHFVPREKKLARSPGRDLKSHFISIATDQSFRAAFDCKSQGKKKESKRNDGNGERTCDHLVSQRNGVQIHVIRQDTAVVMATMAWFQDL